MSDKTKQKIQKEIVDVTDIKSWIKFNMKYFKKHMAMYRKLIVLQIEEEKEYDD